MRNVPGAVSSIRAQGKRGRSATAAFAAKRGRQRTGRLNRVSPIDASAAPSGVPHLRGGGLPTPSRAMFDDVVKAVPTVNTPSVSEVGGLR
jgi:hypothetical protein